MKGFTRCDKGHMYKENVSECPYCPKTGGNANNSEDKTQISGSDSSNSGNDLDKTQIFGGGNQSSTSQKTEVFGSGQSVSSGAKRDLNKTYIQGVTDVEDGDDGKVSAPRATRKLMGWIISYDLDPMGIDYKIYEGRNLLGSSTGCDITVVGDPSISGEHAVILCKNNKFWFSDEMASNGTFLNNEELEPRKPYDLKDGNEIKLGKKTVFKFKSPH